MEAVGWLSCTSSTRLALSAIAGGSGSLEGNRPTTAVGEAHGHPTPLPPFASIFEVLVWRSAAVQEGSSLEMQVTLQLCSSADCGFACCALPPSRRAAFAVEGGRGATRKEWRA